MSEVVGARFATRGGEWLISGARSAVFCPGRHGDAPGTPTARAYY